MHKRLLISPLVNLFGVKSSSSTSDLTVPNESIVEQKVSRRDILLGAMRGALYAVDQPGINITGLITEFSKPNSSPKVSVLTGDGGSFTYNNFAEMMECQYFPAPLSDEFAKNRTDFSSPVSKTPSASSFSCENDEEIVILTHDGGSCTYENWEDVPDFYKAMEP